MREAALDHAHKHRRQALNQLVELLEIPSISTLPEHALDIRRAAEWLAHYLEAIGLENTQIVETEGHPVVYADWLHASDKPTVLIYGHYDVQPPDPLEEWVTPPFEPTVRNENLYARGASDDKGQLCVHLQAVQAFLKTEGELPVNVKFMIEGEEEIGSAHLPHVLQAHRDLFEADVCLISDSQMLAPDRPAIVYGLRGMVYGEIQAEGPRQDLHSGTYGGAVHNPLQALCELLARLHDERGRVTIPGFYDRVRALSDEEREKLARLGYDEKQLQEETGVPATWGEPEFTITERVGARPTLEVHGIRGGFTGAGAKTVIPTRALAKVSMRLVPHQTADEIARSFINHVEALAPQTVHIEARALFKADPALIDRDHPAMEAAAEAYEASFGAPPVFKLDGGSIPVVSLLQSEYGIPVVLMGFGLPDDRLHSPNEKFHLPNFYRGIECAVRFLSGLGHGG